MKNNTTTKNTNRELAAAMRAHGVTPNGDAWTKAKTALAGGATIAQAAKVTLTDKAAQVTPKKATPKKARKQVTVTPPKFREGKRTLACKDCGKRVPRTSGNQKRCKACSEQATAAFLAKREAWKAAHNA